MISKFFIDRPIFAWVIALVILLAGILSLPRLPVSQYPAVAQPAVAINITYPGASSETIERSVISLIEQEMNGIEHLVYMESSAEQGTGTITLTFEAGTNVDLAAVDAQNRLSRVEARLPQAVRDFGIPLTKPTRNFLMVVALFSPDRSYSVQDLGNYASSQILDTIRRTPGVGDVTLFGTEYAMRIWLKPDRMRSFQITPGDVAQAIRNQNAQLSTGAIGQLPAASGQALTAVVSTQGQLSTAKEFGDIVLRTSPQGAIVRVRDVARVELGAQSYDTAVRFNQQPAVGFAVRVSSTGNALDVANAVKAQMEQLSKSFPSGIEWDVPFDTSKFVEISLTEVLHTLIEALILVFIVIFVFLGTLRATIIPAVVVPVSLVGALTVLLLLGYSINVLTMFAMVLAIGLVVDDAIVVLENVERLMEQEHLSPRKAAIKAMQQITGAVVGITLVLMSVFIPLALFGGSTGVIYRQFAVTLAVTLAFSAFLALTLTPALCATILKPASHGRFRGGILGWFYRAFPRITNAYDRANQKGLQHLGVSMVIYLVIVAVMGFAYSRMSSGFLPDEDQSFYFTVFQLPAGATSERADVVLKKLETFTAQQPEIKGFFGVLGFSFFGRGQNSGIMFVQLKDWDERKGPDHSVKSLVERALAAGAQVKEAFTFSVQPPPILELSALGGFDFRLKDSGGQGWAKLLEVRNQVLGMAGQDKTLIGVHPEGQEPAPQFQLNIDWAKAQVLGVKSENVIDALQSMLGGAAVDNFVRSGRTLRVMMQGESSLTSSPEHILDMPIRAANNKVIDLREIAQGRWSILPPKLDHYNGVLAVKIAGNPAPGFTSGDAIKAMEKIATKLPPGYTFEWSTTSREEIFAGQNTLLLFGLAVLMVFLTLAALYESWTLPVSVLLVVPLGMVGAILAVTVAQFSNDIYFRVGMVTIVGLASKNAILIIEFARSLTAQGMDAVHAAIEAARLRFRPIIMTSLAFIFGVLPLVISTGAGAESRREVGTGVLGGMITATVLAVFLVPAFFVIVEKIFPPKPPHED